MRALIFALIVTLVPPSQRPGKHLCFVVDTSGSMAGLTMARAVEAFSTYAGQPIDEAELCVYAFSDHVARLDWRALPDANYVREVEDWLASKGGNGCTLVVPALRAALAEDKAELTVVLVTDGIFDESDEVVAAAVKAAQDKRRQRAVIGVIGVHAADKVNPALKAVEDGGGYYVMAQE